MLIELLPRLTELETLDVSACKIDDTLMPCIVRLEHLKEFSALDTAISAQAEEFFYEQKPDAVFVR